MKPWKEIPKKKRDQILLISVGGLFALAVLYVFVLSPGLRARGEGRTRHQELKEKLALADRMNEQFSGIRKRGMRDREQVKTDLEQRLPTTDNTVLWASRIVDEAARAENLSLESLNELAAALPSWVQPAEGRARKLSADPAAGEGDIPVAPPRIQRRFGPYRVTITVKGDFRDITLFLARLERENPYVNVGSLTILPSESSRTVQQAAIILEWPRHSGPVDTVLSDFLRNPVPGEAMP